MSIARLHSVVVLGFVTLTGLALLGCGSAEPAPHVTWEATPRVIAQGSSAQLILRPSGELGLLYVGSGSTPQTRYLTSMDGGDTFAPSSWSAVDESTPNVHGESVPQLRIGSRGKLFAAWHGQGDIQVAGLDHGPMSGAAVRVTESSRSQDAQPTAIPYFAMAVGPDEVVYVAWLDTRDRDQNPPGTMSIYVARSDDRGKTFGPHVRAVAGVCPCCRPALAPGENGDVWLVWRHVLDGARDIAMSRSTDRAQTWSPLSRVATDDWRIDGCPHSGPDISVSGSELEVTWYTAANGVERVLRTRSTGGGASFEPPRVVSGEVLDPNHPSLASVGGRPWVVFQGRDPDERSGWGGMRAWWSDSGSAPQPFPSLGGSVGYPRLYTGSTGRVFALWTESTDTEDHVVMLRGRVADVVAAR